MRNTNDMPMEYVNIKVKELYELLMSPFSAENALEDEKNRTICSPILNYALNSGTVVTVSVWVARYSSTNELLMDSLQNK